MADYRYNVGSAFGAVARASPHATALQLPEGETVTYAELNALANRVAGVFARHGVGRHSVVGIVHTKTPVCYAAMLAALKMGAPYVNLDDQNPPTRLAHIFGTARPAVVCGETLSTPIKNEISKCGAATVEFAASAVAAELAAASSDEPNGTLAIGSDPAYIMYTSGSTGVPKGASMTHANVLNFASWCAARFGIGPRDVLTNVNPMYFDNSVFDFYGALLNGASIAPVKRETLANAAQLLAQVEAARCTVWFSVPSLLIYLSTMKLLQNARLPDVRCFVFGGEGYPKPELRKLFSEFAHRSRLVNVYGPTECTCICSAWDVTSGDLEDAQGLVTLGPVADNFSMLVLDGDRAVSPGETGELCLLGPQVGLGYLNDPQRTATAFVRNPLNDSWHERMYRTGDLVRLGRDGRMLDFVGRKDNQIKHMGYRIELEEIESAINRVAGIAQSAVVQKASRREQKILVAYVAGEGSLTEDVIRKSLEELLPPYMIPQRFEIRPSLPKNPNGKVDRVALAAE